MWNRFRFDKVVGALSVQLHYQAGSYTCLALSLLAATLLYFYRSCSIHNYVLHHNLDFNPTNSVHWLFGPLHKIPTILDLVICLKIVKPILQKSECEIGREKAIIVCFHTFMCH